jgi:hypothetical protein
MPRNFGPYGAATGAQHPVVQLFKPKQTRQHFTPADDERIIEAVGQQAYPNWSKIAELVPGKTGRQCRERFQHYLSRDLAQAPWSTDEDDLIRRLYSEYGPDWARIAQHFGGRRTNNNIKNRWNNHLTCKRGRPSGLPVPDLQVKPQAVSQPGSPAQLPRRTDGVFDAFSDTGWPDVSADAPMDWFGDAGLPDASWLL